MQIASRVAAGQKESASWKINLSAGRFNSPPEVYKTTPGPRTIEAVRQAVLEAVDHMLKDPHLLDDPDLCIWLQWNN